MLFVVTLLMVTISGKLLPLTPVGTWMLIWNTPVTRPGAAPANCTGAGWPPMVAVTVEHWPGWQPGILRRPLAFCGIGVTDPVVPGGLVWPPPVPYTEITLPCGAGAYPWPD